MKLRSARRGICRVRVRVTTARGTDGKPGSGVYSISNKCEVASPKVEELLATFRKDGTAEKVWDYFAADFKRITGVDVPL